MEHPYARLTPDLVLDASSDATGPIQKGHAVRYSVTVANVGEGVAHHVTVTDRLPSGVERPGTVFYRDVTPGTYTFTVEPYGGLPTGQADTVKLAPGTHTYLQVQWLPSWQVGYPEATWSDAPNTFGILTMSAHLAQAYIPTMTNLGQR